MRQLSSLITVLVLALGLSCAHAQQDFSKVEIKATKVAGHIYMLTGAGGNIGVSAGPDGVLIVDDQFAPLAEKIRAALKAINPGPLKFILNTHYHGDHTGGNATFGKDGTIIAQENVRKRLASGGIVRGEEVKPEAPEGLPVITFDQSLSVHFNGEEIKAVFYPAGHTDGDSVIFFTGANVVHLGDHFFAGRFPFIDLEHGGTVAGMTKNVGDIIARLPADVQIIPGHGPLSKLDDLKLYHRMLLETSAFVEKEVRAGRSLAEIKQAGLPAEWKEWGTGFIKSDAWIDTLAQGAAKK